MLFFVCVHMHFIQSKQISETNVTSHAFQQISDLKIFFNAAAGHWRCCVDPSPGVYSRGAKNHKGGLVLNAILDVCSNRKAKYEMGGTDFKWGAGHHWSPTGNGPDAVAGNMRPAGL